MLDVFRLGEFLLMLVVVQYHTPVLQHLQQYSMMCCPEIKTVMPSYCITICHIKEDRTKDIDKSWIFGVRGKGLPRPRFKRRRRAPYLLTHATEQDSFDTGFVRKFENQTLTTRIQFKRAFGVVRFGRGLFWMC